MTEQPPIKMMKMAPSFETVLTRHSILATQIKPVAQTRSRDLLRRICGI